MVPYHAPCHPQPPVRRSGRAEGRRFGAGAAIGATEDHAGARPGVPPADDGDRPAGGGHAGRKPCWPAGGGAADAGPSRARRPAQPAACGGGGSWRPVGGPDLLWPDRQLGADQAADRRRKAGDRQAGSVRSETADRPSGSAGDGQRCTARFARAGLSADRRRHQPPHGAVGGRGADARSGFGGVDRAECHRTLRLGIVHRIAPRRAPHGRGARPAGL